MTDEERGTDHLDSRRSGNKFMMPGAASDKPTTRKPMAARCVLRIQHLPTYRDTFHSFGPLYIQTVGHDCPKSLDQRCSAEQEFARGRMNEPTLFI
jgi:hypothetical protein